jgi:hypothetical protein
LLLLGLIGNIANLLSSCKNKQLQVLVAGTELEGWFDVVRRYNIASGEG